MNVLFEVMDRVVEHRNAELVEADQGTCPPTQSIAAIPTFESTDRMTGMARTSPLPNDAASPSRVCASRKPTSSIFTIRATAP